MYVVSPHYSPNVPDKGRFSLCSRRSMPVGVVVKNVVLVAQVAWVYSSACIPCNTERDCHQFQCLTFVLFAGSYLFAHFHHYAGSMWSSGRGAASTTLGTRSWWDQEWTIHTGIKTAWLWLEVATKWSLAPVQFRQGPGKLGARTFAFCQVPQNV